jgi:hypothetical protein
MLKPQNTGQPVSFGVDKLFFPLKSRAPLWSILFVSEFQVKAIDKTGKQYN